MNIKVIENGIENEYKIKFGYNSFCDTDLMDKVENLAKLLSAGNAKNDKDVSMLGKFKDLFLVVRELLFVGMKKYNPVDSLQDVGNILDLYKEQETESDTRGIINLFGELSEELMNEGFLSGLLQTMEKQMKTDQKKPQDHLKAEKK